MRKKSWIPVVLILLVWPGVAAMETTGFNRSRDTAAAETARAQLPEVTKASREAGTALLDLFIDNLREMSRQGTVESLDRRLQRMMTTASENREAGRIDPVFFYRFNRLLAVTKLITFPDPSGTLGPLIDATLSDFVLDKLGHHGFREEGGKGPKAVNYVAQALSEEVINLQIYLDTLEERQKLQKKIADKMNRPPDR